MKTIKIVSAIMLMSAMAFAKPHPKSSAAKEHMESVKESKIAKKKVRENNMRYKHEARERRHFNNM